MAVVFQMEKDGSIRDGLLGFSWTSFFFTPFVPLFRKDIPSFIGVLAVGFVINIGQNVLLERMSSSYDSELGGLMLFALIVTVIGLIWCSKYNKMYTRKLLEKGWRPVDSEGVRLLKEAGLGSYLMNLNNDDEYDYVEIDEEENNDND